MAMVSPSTALKLSQYVTMFFGTFMTFFPAPLMDGYKGDTFVGEANALFQFMMGIFGTQMLLMSMIFGACARDAVPAASQSVACLASACFWVFFAVSDGRHLITGTLPGAIPPDGVIGNLFLFAMMAGVSLAGWVDGGKVKPDFGKFVPTGPAKAPLTVAMLNLLSFGVPLTLMTRTFMDMFWEEGFLERLPGTTVTVKDGPFASKTVPVGPLEGPLPMMELIMGNAGKCVLTAVLTALAVISVGGDEAAGDVTFRMLRAFSLQGMFYVGTLARDGVLLTATGWPSLMRVPLFLQTFGVCFYIVNQMAALTPVLPAAAKSKKK